MAPAQGQRATAGHRPALAFRLLVGDPWLLANRRPTTKGWSVPATAYSMTDRELAPCCPLFFQIFLVFLIFFLAIVRKYGDGLGISGEWVYCTPKF
jgi:hypothetical protein